MKKNIFQALLPISASAVIAVSGVASGQIVGRATQQDWANGGGDVQRTNWQRISPNSPASRTISPETVSGKKIDFSSPEEMSGFGLQIKTKLENTSRNGAALSGGSTITSAGLGLNMGLLGASGNSTIGLDMDTGYEFFVTKYSGENPKGSATCPGSSLATPARTAVLSIARPADSVPTPDGTGQIGYWAQSYAPGVGISNQKTAGTIMKAQTTAEASAALGGRFGGGPPAPAATGPATPINLPGSAIGSGQDAHGGALPEAPTGRKPLLYGAEGAIERTNPIGPGAGVSNNTYTISNDGKVHFLTQQFGLEAVKPMEFIPIGAQATDPIHLNSVLYTTTVNDCGGAPNGVWGVTTIMISRGPGSQVDPRNPSSFRSFGVAAPTGPDPTGLPPLPAPGQVFKWETGGTASPTPITFLSSGVAVIATSSGTGMGDSIITLNTPATQPVTEAAKLELSVKAKFTQAGADFIGSPVVLPTLPHTPVPYGTKAPPAGANLIAAQARDGRIFILDEALTKPLVVTEPVAGLGGYKPAGLSSWVDDSGQRWLLSTTPTSVIAYKLNIDGSTATLSKGWNLAGLQAPLAPIIVNGVVFIASSGEFVPAKGTNATEAARIAASKPAVLYAVNAVTGAKLWDSGKTITSFVPHTSALWASLGQVLLSTYNNTFYAFGANMERHSNKSIEMAH